MPRKFASPFTAGMIWGGTKSVRIGERRYRVSEWRLRDLGLLESRIATIAGNPAREIGKAIEGLNSARASKDRDAIEEASFALRAAEKEWPPRLGGDRFHEIMRTTAGREVYLSIALRRRNKVSRAECSGLAYSITSSEWHDLESVLWGRIPFEANPPAEDDGPSDGINWSKNIRVLMGTYGLTPDQVGDLTWRAYKYLVAAVDPDQEAVCEMWIDEGD